MEIKLSNGESVLLDPEDYERVKGFQWKKQLISRIAQIEQDGLA